MTEWKSYRRMGTTEMRPYIPGEPIDGVSVSDVDREKIIAGKFKGYIARDKENHNDQWLVSQSYFEKQQFAEVTE